MNTDFVAILGRLDELFPIDRTNTEFKGHHHLTLEDGVPQLNIWIREGDRFRMIHVTCELEDFEKSDIVVWEEIQAIVKEWCET